MRQFPILQKEFLVSDGRANYNKYYLEFKEKAIEAGDTFLKLYNDKFHSIEDVIEHALDVGNLIIQHYLEECTGYIIQLGVYNIDEEKFAKEYYLDKFYVFGDSYQQIYDKYMDIVLTEEEKEEYRQMRKQNRGRWQGGGFGLAGAIKGSATAGAMNLVSGAMHSVFNLGGKMLSSIAASREKDKLFNNTNIDDVLADGVRDSVFYMVYALTNYIKITGIQEISLVLDDHTDEAKTLINNLKKNIVPEEKRLDLVFKAWELDPYQKETYRYIVSTYGDPQNEIETLADYFGVSIHDVKEGIIQQFNKQIDFSTEEKLLEGKSLLITLIKQLGLQESEIKELKEVNDKLHKYDLGVRTVDEIVFETREEAAIARKELESIEAIISKMNKNSEASVIEAKEKIQALQLKTSIQDKHLKQIDDMLEKFDLEARTVDEMVFETREEASITREGIKSIEAIISKMDKNSEESVIEAKKSIQEFHLRSSIMDKYLEPIDAMLEEYDLQARIVDRMVFETREEAAIARKELESIEAIISKMDKSSETSVIEAKEKIQALQLKTSIQDKHLKSIDAMLKKLDLEARKYKGVVYDTREAATLCQKEEEMIEAIYNEIDMGSLNSIDKAFDKISQLSWSTNIKEEYVKKIKEERKKLIAEREKVIYSFKTVLTNITISSRDELDAYINKIKKSEFSADIKKFVIEQIDKKIKVENNNIAERIMNNE